MKKTIFALSLLFAACTVHAQEKFYTKSGMINFYSKAPVENIEAVNKSVTCVLDTKSGALQFAVLMKGFEFQKALMQDHFNENYIESDKYPLGEFKGQIDNPSAIDFTKDGAYTVAVKGKLTLHGISKDVEAKGKIAVQGGKLLTSSDFIILLSDYSIKIPGLVEKNISNNITITVNCALEPLSN